MSPTEKRGRVHSSSVTVSVTDPNMQVNPAYQKRNPEDFRIEWFSGTGAGGQYRNRHQNTCRFIHIPTGLVEVRGSRSRENNLKDAKQAIIQKLDQMARSESSQIISTIRKDQVGSGMRGDKVRTLQFTNDIAKNHQNGKQMSAEKFMKGFMDILW